MNDFTRTYQHYVWVSWEAANVPTHDETLRIDYTVPSNEYAVLQYGWIHMLRDGQGTAGGIYYIRVAITLSESPTGLILLTYSDENRAGVFKTAQLSCPIYLRPGDKIKAWTRDSVPSATVSYSINLLVTTYK